MPSGQLSRERICLAWCDGAVTLYDFQSRCWFFEDTSLTMQPVTFISSRWAFNCASSVSNEYVCSIAVCGMSCCLLTLGCRLQFAKCSLGLGLLSDRGVICKATFVVLFEQFALLFLQLGFWLYMLHFSSITFCLFVELFALVSLYLKVLSVRFACWLSTLRDNRWR